VGLDGHIPLQTGVVSLVNRCHPTLAELLEDVVATQGLTDKRSHHYFLLEEQHSLSSMSISSKSTIS